MDQVYDNLPEVLWITLVAILVIAASVIARRLVNRASARIPELAPVVNVTQRPFVALVVVLAVRIALAGTDIGTDGLVYHLLAISLIVAVVWLVVALVSALEGIVLLRLTSAYASDAVQVRRVSTQVTLLRRLVVAIVVLVGIGAALMTFPAFQVVGTSLLASAGLVSVITGLAAQTTLSNVIAGMQLSLNNSIRIGDIVSVEGESGTVGEITLTYVVIYLWDDRRLILPTSHFVRTPFENWTRRGDKITGRVTLDLDWTAPFDDMREELDRVLTGSEHWDGRSSRLMVSDVAGGNVQVAIVFSAANALDMFGLQREVREAMVRFLVGRGYDGLPRAREVSIQDSARLRRAETDTPWTHPAEPDGDNAPQPSSGADM